MHWPSAAISDTPHFNWKLIAARSGGRSSVVGTPYWMSPEVIGDQPYGASTDVWSAGVVLRELLQRRPPYFDLPVFRAMYLIRTQVPPSMRQGAVVCRNRRRGCG